MTSTLNPYLTFDGNCADVFDFYRSVFGGDFATKMHFKDVPEGMPVQEGEEEKLMHISLPIGNAILMGSDRAAVMGSGTVGNNFTISYNAADEADAKKIFDGLSAKGQVTMPLQKTFWAAAFGMLTDQYGIQWMVSFNDASQL